MKALLKKNRYICTRTRGRIYCGQIYKIRGLLSVLFAWRDAMPRSVCAKFHGFRINPIFPTMVVLHASANPH